MQRYPELLAEGDYSKAMLLADELIVTLRSGSYRGVSYRDLTLWQVAVAEGFTSEELRLFVDRSGPGSGLLLHSNVERICQGILRSAALRKANISGTAGLFVPVEERDGILRRSGMVTIIERMLTQVRAKGVRLFYDSKVTGIDRVPGDGSNLMRLSFLDGRSLIARRVVLNIGQPDLLALGLNSEPLKSAPELFRRAIERVRASPYAKTYCFWEDAWWVTKLNKTVGVVRTADQSMFSARYHDGDYVCSQPEEGGPRKCRGAMLVSYIAGDTTGGGSAITVRMHNDKPYTPLTNSDAIRVIVRSNMSAHDTLYFDELHRQLRRVHGPVFEARGMDVSRELPDAIGCVVADWSATGVHSERGAGRRSENVFEMYTRPVEDLHLALVNEGWAETYGWAESSLRSAERALLHSFGVARPSWLDEDFHAAVIHRFNLG
ncbi:Gal-2,6-Sulfurylases I [Gracilaria domingensis]|nr:Gal-2,6-Sulfurylases I [Gracilaria domingensis]